MRYDIEGLLYNTEKKNKYKYDIEGYLKDKNESKKFPPDFGIGENATGFLKSKPYTYNEDPINAIKEAPLSKMNSEAAKNLDNDLVKKAITDAEYKRETTFGSLNKGKKWREIDETEGVPSVLARTAGDKTEIEKPKPSIFQNQLAKDTVFVGRKAAEGLPSALENTATGLATGANYLTNVIDPKNEVIRNKQFKDAIDSSSYDRRMAHNYKQLMPTKEAEFIGGVVESVTAMIPTITLSAVTGGAGIPATASRLISGVAIALKAGGSATKEALNAGSDFSNAAHYALMQGVTEAVVENIGGAIPFMDESFITSLVNKVVKNKAAMTGLSILIDATGEGLEEVISDLLTPLYQRWTFDPVSADTDLEDFVKSIAQDWDPKEIAKSFAAGALSGLIFSGMNTAAEKAKGIAGNINQDNFKGKEGQADVFDVERVVNNVISGTEVTAEERAMFAPAVENAENRAQLEEALGVILPETKAGTDALIKRLNWDSINDLSAKRQNLAESQARFNRQINDMQERIRPKGMPLEQNVMQGKNIQAASNLEMPQVFKNIASKAKLDIVYDSNLGETKGSYDGKTIRINPKYAASQMTYIFGHELAHDMQTETEIYKPLKDHVSEMLAKEGLEGETLKQAILDKQLEYRDKIGQELSETAAMEEIEAKYLERLFDDDKTINRLAVEKPSLFTRVKEWIEDAITRFKGTAAEKALLKTRQLYVEAARNIATEKSGNMEAAGNLEAVQAFKNIEYSVKNEDEVFGKYGIQNIHDVVEVRSKVLKKIKDTFISSNQNIKQITNTSTGMQVEVWPSGIKETFGNIKYYTKLPTNLKIAKIASIEMLPELIKNGIIRKKEARNYHNPESKSSFAYLQSEATINGIEYQVNIDIKRIDNSDRFYIHSIDLKNSLNTKTIGKLPPRQAAFNNEPALVNEGNLPIINNSISQNKENVNTDLQESKKINLTKSDKTKYSVDSDGEAKSNIDWESLENMGVKKGSEVEYKPNEQRDVTLERTDDDLARVVLGKGVSKDPSGGYDQLLSSVMKDPAPKENPNRNIDFNAMPTSSITLDTMPTRAQKEVNMYNNVLAKKLAKAFSTPHTEQSFLLNSIKDMTDKIIENGGKLSIDDQKSLFLDMYERGKVVLDDYWNDTKDLRTYLRGITFNVSDIRNEFPDFTDSFIKGYMGKLRLSYKSGIPIDEVWGHLVERFNFPDDLGSNAHLFEYLVGVVDGMQKIEYSLKTYYNEENPETRSFRESIQYEYNEAINEYEQNIRNAVRYAEDRRKAEVKREKTIAKEQNITYEKLLSLHKRNAEIKREFKNKTQHILLTDRDKVFVKSLAEGVITENDLPADINRRGVIEYAKELKERQDVARPLQKYRTALKSDMLKEAESYIFNIQDWKDKKTGIQFEREIPERNFVDVAGRADGQNIVDNYIKPIHANEATGQRYIRRLAQNALDLNLTRKQSMLVQYLGEGNPESDIASRLKMKVSQKDIEKAKAAIPTFRAIYNELYSDLEKAYVMRGYEPPQRRKDYFPHFGAKSDPITELLSKHGFDFEGINEDGGKGVFLRFLQKLGVDISAADLPTDIAGRTESFRPTKQWFSNALERKGNETAYDALTGLGMYLEGAKNVIYHTEDIQKLRALEQAIRSTFNSEKIDSKINEIQNNPNLGSVEKIQAIQDIRDRTNNKFPNLVTWLTNYTNILAGKKSIRDRVMESDLNRAWYRITTNVFNRITSNMMGFNVASWFTNWIPITQVKSMVKGQHILQAMQDTLKSYGKDDGFQHESNFLTNRQDGLSLSQTSFEKMIEKGQAPMFYIDNFAAQVVTRALYNKGINDGLSHPKALEYADDYAAKLMAARSKGARPTLFEDKNLFSKTFTAFQLEVNNQYSYFFKDLPRGLKEEGKGVGTLIMRLLQAAIGAWAYNEIYKAVFGRRTATDPIDIVNEGIKNYSSMNFGEATLETFIEAGREVPFIGNLIGGSRYPTEAGVPDLRVLIGDNVASKKLKELGKPLTYLVPPTGGGAGKKIIEAGMDIAKGGRYNETKAGNKLYYPVEPTVGNIIKGIIGGRSALTEAQEFWDSGDKILSEKDTVTVDNFPKGKKADAYKYVRDINELKSEGVSAAKTRENIRNYILDSKMTDEQKKYMYNSYYSGDVIKYREAENRLKDNKQFKALTADSRIDLLESISKYYTADTPDYKTKIADISGIGVAEYMLYKTYISKLDAKNSKGGSEAGLRKKRVVEYVAGLNMGMEQKLMLIYLSGANIRDIGIKGYSDRQLETMLANYIGSLKVKDTEKVKIAQTLGFTVKNGKIILK